MKKIGGENKMKKIGGENKMRKLVGKNSVANRAAISAILLSVFMICTTMTMVAIPQQDHTFYGTATLDGVALTKEDTDVTITLEVEGYEFANYTMGDIETTDDYVLMVKMDSDGVPAGAKEGDTGYIYINGISVDQNPVTIGAPGANTHLDISAVSPVSPPTITAVSPTDGATDVPVTTTISATFSEAMNETSAEAAFSITPTVAGTFSWDGNTMTFTPDADLAYNTTYTIMISTTAEDLAGNNLEEDYTWAFTTAERFELPFSVIPEGTTTIMNITVDAVIPTNVGENATIVFFGETAEIDSETYYVTTMTKPVGGTKFYSGVNFATEDFTQKREVGEGESGVELANLTYDPVYVLFDYPLWLGKTWTTTVNVTGTVNESGTEIQVDTTAVITGNVTDEVDVTVPFGTIHCLVVEVNASLQNPPISCLQKYWLCGAVDAIPKYQRHVNGVLVEELELISITIPDTTPPEIFNPQPPDGSFINDTTPTISANYSDPSVINVSSVEMRVDGDIVSPDSVTETGVSYIPTTDLSEGLHTVTVNVSDNAVSPNTNSTSWSFTVDITKPTIEFVEPPTPENNTEVSVNYVNVTVNVTDNFDLTQAVGILWWNGDTEPMTKIMYALNNKSQFYFNKTNLANGDYTYKVYANDTAGNMNVSETRVVTVNKTEVSPGDFNDDGYVNIDDVVYMVVNLWGPCTPGAPGDFTNDGYVNIDDVVYLVVNLWGPCP